MESVKRILYGLLNDNLYRGKVLLVFGARRVGKTFLVKELLKYEQGVYYNCELLEVREMLDSENSTLLQQAIGNHKLVVFDEAQAIPAMGQKLKILHDTFPHVQLIATGSSSFELKQITAEPLTGRSRIYQLFPYSFREISDAITYMEAYAHIENLLRFGSYPDVFLKSYDEKREELMNITSGYLYKDILTYGNLKRPDIVHELLKLLAFQIGKEVSLNELSNKMNTSVHTVSRYLDLLEKSFVIVGISAYSRNLRNEIGKAKKYYFMDCGIRNAIINNFNPLSQRNDIGMLWENFCVMERLKKNEYERRFVNTYFWRTYDQQEIDYIEESGGELKAFEMKWNDQKVKYPRAFMTAYPGSTFDVITKRNLADFI